MTTSASRFHGTPLLGVFATALALVGCGGGGGSSGPPPAPAMMLSASSLTFTAQAVGTTSAAQTITVNNTGTAALTVSGVAISGTDAGSFADTTTCASVMAGASCTIDVTYTPTAIGAASATLGITANVSGSPVGVTLSGTGTSAAGSNTVSAVIDAGPAALTNPAVNLLYVSVTVCVPGTSTCQVVDHIQVDTGSVGLRVLAGALNSSVAAGLVTTTSGAGHALLECTQFADGYSWGPLKAADVTIGGKSLAALPIQVIGDPVYPGSISPAACQSGPGGAVEEDTVAVFGANGIIGLGYFLEDCGASCPADGTAYSDCTTTTCTGYAAMLAEQVPNPVSRFTGDNNGVIIEVPTVPLAGGTDVAATIVFGIGTAANNGLAGSVIAYPVSASTGQFTAVYNGTTLSESFVDSGSNAYYFPNLAPVLATCALPNASFYCPAPDTSITPTIRATNNATVAVTVPINNLNELSAGITAFPGIAGTISGLPSTFDFGLGFFFGRTVYIGFEGTTLGGAAAPAIAF